MTDTTETNIVIITLGRNRTKTQSFNDAALANGYQEIITTTKTVSVTTSYDELMAAGGTPNGYLASIGITGENAKFANSLIPGASATIIYQEISAAPNPVTAQAFGANIWAARCDEFDRQMMLDAAKIRDEQATPTVIS